MNAEVIAIGDELTSGGRLDTNSQWISQRLAELGVATQWHSTVGDHLDWAADVFRTAIQRADIVVASGGLGPTADDITREAIAQATSTPLILHQPALDHIEALFRRFNRPMPERNRRQAMFPAGSRPVPNPHGTAPGIDMNVGREGSPTCRLFALPGVPVELFEMWDQTVRAEIMAGRPTGRVLRCRRIKCFGAGESHIEKMLPDMIRRGRDPMVGITASQATITLRIIAGGATDALCEAALEPTVATIHDCLGELVFGQEDDELEHAVARLLEQANRSVAIAEMGTGGLISQWLADREGSERWYRGGWVVPSTASACGLLGGALDDLGDHGSVVRQLASDCLRRTGADYGLAVGPLPQRTSTVAAEEGSSECGPVAKRSESGARGDPTPAEQAQDDAQGPFVALATAEGVAARRLRLVGHPAIWKVVTAKQTLNWLRLTLIRPASRSGA